MAHNHNVALWGVDNTVIVLKLSGEWRFEKSALLDYFIQKILPAQKVSNLVIDLTAVTLLDSTILGLLAQIGIAFEKQSRRKATFISTQSEINALLSSLAFDTIFNFSTHTALSYPELTPLKVQALDAQTLEDTVLQSHKTLTSLSEDNQRAFADLIKMLEEKT